MKKRFENTLNFLVYQFLWIGNLMVFGMILIWWYEFGLNIAIIFALVIMIINIDVTGAIQKDLAKKAGMTIKN